MATVVQADESNSQRLMDKAKEFGERQRQQEKDDEMAGTMRRARDYVEKVSGTHVAGANTPPHTRRPVSHTVDETVGKGQVRIGNMTLNVEAARASGFVDGDGNLTDKGQTLAGRGGSEGPSRAEANPHAHRDSIRRTPPRGHAFADGFNYVTFSRGATLGSIPEAEIKGLIAQLRGVADREGSQADIAQLQGELERRAGVQAESREQQREAPADTKRSEDAADVLSGVDEAFADGDLDTVAEAAEVAIEGLRGSESYGSAVDAFLRDGTVPDAKAAQAIASELGISPGDADTLIDVAVAGFASEARQAAEPIVGAENVDAFAEWVRLVPGTVRRAATHQLRGGSLVGWQEAAREFREALSEFNGLNLEDAIGKHEDGSIVWKDKSTGQLLVNTGGRTLDFRAALAAGVMNILD